MQLILSIYHVICSVTSKINIKNSAKFNIRSTSRLTYDIIMSTPFATKWLFHGAQ